MKHAARQGAVPRFSRRYYNRETAEAEVAAINAENVFRAVLVPERDESSVAVANRVCACLPAAHVRVVTESWRVEVAT